MLDTEVVYLTTGDVSVPVSPMIIGYQPCD